MNLKKNRQTIILGILYLLATSFTILGEYEKNVTMLKFSKPFIIPLIALMYYYSTKKMNRIYMAALVFAWLANLFFIIQTEQFIFKGAISYLVFWVLITFLLLVNTSFPDRVSFTIALIPFTFVYCCVLQLIYETLHNSIFLFFLNGIFMTFLGAYSLARYFNNSNKTNTYLLICILLFTFIQFLVSLDLYYVSVKIFRPLSMLLYACGQFFLLKTFLAFDQRKIKE